MKTRLYRVQRYNRAGHHCDTRVMTQWPAVVRLAEKWANWPSTSRVTIASTLTPGWQAVTEL